MNWDAIFLTLRLAALTALVLWVAGTPLAYWLSFSRWRWKFLAESVVALPLVLPPTVLGFYILVALGPNSPFGQVYGALTGSQLPFTFGGLLVASVLYSLPFAVQPFANGFGAVPVSLLEASWMAGASPLRTFWRVVLPLSRPSVVTGLVLSFAHTMGEFGVVLMVGGNIPGATQTAAIDVYDKTQSLRYGEAGATALFLLVLSYLVLSIVYGYNRRIQRALNSYL
ncbi:MAG: molybdate ABC transporter permease subunit [Chloroflexota bacterium]